MNLQVVHVPVSARVRERTDKAVVRDVKEQKRHRAESRKRSLEIVFAHVDVAKHGVARCRERRESAAQRVVREVYRL